MNSFGFKNHKKNSVSNCFQRPVFLCCCWEFHELTTASSFLFPLLCPTFIHLPSSSSDDYSPCSAPCTLHPTRHPKACLSPLQMPRIRQADVGAPWGRPQHWWNSGSPAWAHSLCWVQPLGSVYLIFSQLWGVGLATAYKTQSAWPRYNPHPPSFFWNHTCTRLHRIHTFTCTDTTL